MNRKRNWSLGLSAIALIWLIAMGGRCALRRGRETAETAAAFAGSRDPEQLAGRERERTIHSFVGRVNRLPFDERQRFFADPRTVRFIERLDDSERLRVFEETLPSGISELLDTFSRMNEEQRKDFVERASRQVERMTRDLDSESLPPERRAALEEALDTAVRHGLRAYLSEADAQTKIELQPVLLQMQQLMQRGRR